ncbi:error-prone DNA polymerase [Corynebacterium poyangense]|uniref:Error-prone DNA polymerase n=1 Tax=Corynebacterium poyangense TaxID=2684405 RepID=A0A7H0SMC1_9CORY|nr:error-prone DNA polymerase [Corynebacterium poyangense]QNQ89696.1 error-prone DNA polymerase [Corynebacterium poyangense]
MHFHGGEALSWSRLERILSGQPGPEPVPAITEDDGFSPQSLELAKPGGFAELHAYSSFNFKDGASHPETMVLRAAELGLEALALLDRDGFYGSVRFAEAAKALKLPTVFGAELSLQEGILPILCRSPEGYRRLSRLISEARMKARNKDAVCYPELGEILERGADTWVFLADHHWAHHIELMIDIVGNNSVVREYEVTMLPDNADHHCVVDQFPTRHGILTARPAVATVHDKDLARAKRSLAHHQSVGAARGRIHPMGAPWLRSAEQMRRMFPGRPDLLSYTVELAQECAFDLDLLAPNLPNWDVPPGHTEMTWLRELVAQGWEQRYGKFSDALAHKAKHQIDYELALIEQLNFPGYFLIIHGIVQFCRHSGILCQGRGSAANSAVCFALGITNVEPMVAELLFERFLSPERDGPPDIDLDIESGRREEVIQYVYHRYGRENAAQVANVISYRRKGARRDAGRALGYPQGTIDSWSRRSDKAPEQVEKLAEKFLGHPRHLGIHSGGMVICDRPIADVVPIEWARMANRSVVQWDKEDCAVAGLVKFDLLGLGMLSALHAMIDLVARHRGQKINLWEIDLTEEPVYEMLCRADAIGVFQVESRAQLATLPRLQPRTFFDLVVEVALIRPGPIQGGSVHPYLRRRRGEEEITYDHPVLEKSLRKTLGVPLFQEQLMHIAVDAAGFSAAEADALRRAMGSQRSTARMAVLREKFFQGLAATSGIVGDTAEALWHKILAFAAYGFPESHAQSFASLVYFSAWFKYHYPAEFCVGLLRSQPMGFYSPQSLVADARRHGVPILPVCVHHSGVAADSPEGAIRLGLSSLKGLPDSVAQRIVAARNDGLFRSIADLARRADLTVQHTEILARGGALECLVPDRRRALWEAGVAATEHDGMFPGLSDVPAPALPGMSTFELFAADIAATGITPAEQPMFLLRKTLAEQGVLCTAALSQVPDGSSVEVAGIITHRQRPRTASGVIFLGMEDETGLANIVVSPGLWRRYEKVARTSRGLVVRGKVQNRTGAVLVVADKLSDLQFAAALSRGSRDFR